MGERETSHRCKSRVKEAIYIFSYRKIFLSRRKFHKKTTRRKTCINWEVHRGLPFISTSRWNHEAKRYTFLNSVVCSRRFRRLQVSPCLYSRTVQSRINCIPRINIQELTQHEPQDLFTHT